MIKIPSARNLLLLLGALLLVFPIWTTATWIRIFERPNLSYEKKVATFMSLFPEVIGGPPTITLLALACSVVALLAGLICLAGVTGIRKLLCIVEISLGGLFCLWLLFTLM